MIIRQRAEIQYQMIWLPRSLTPSEKKEGEKQRTNRGKIKFFVIRFDERRIKTGERKCKTVKLELCSTVSR
jgi:hypothetical protein